MSGKVLFVAMVMLFSAGCASVPMESKEYSSKAKLFNPPPEGKSGLYIFRVGGAGGSLKKDIWVDGKCIGESAPNVFFYDEVEGDQEHTIATESEFSPNELKIFTKSRKNYFIEQYIKLGLFVGGADLRVVSEKEGKNKVSRLEMAKKGICSK